MYFSSREKKEKNHRLAHPTRRKNEGRKEEEELMKNENIDYVSSVLHAIVTTREKQQIKAHIVFI